MAKRLV